MINGLTASVQAASGFNDILVYRKGEQSVYIKHVFANKVNQCLKPAISARDIDLIRQLDGLNLRYYVLVHIKNANSSQFDVALFLDDYEAIQGIAQEVALQRVMPLPMAFHIINSILL